MVGRGVMGRGGRGWGRERVAGVWGRGCGGRARVAGVWGRGCGGRGRVAGMGGGGVGAGVSGAWVWGAGTGGGGMGVWGRRDAQIGRLYVKKYSHIIPFPFPVAQTIRLM